MNILITRFPFSSILGGEEIHTVQVAKGLKAKGHNVYLFTNCPVLSGEFTKNNIPVFQCFGIKPPVSKLQLIIFTLLLPIQLIWYIWKINPILKRHKIDTIYMLSLGEKLLLTYYLHIKKLKVFWLEHARIGRWLTSNPYLFLYKKLSKYALTITTSAMMKDIVNKYAKNTVDIPCSVTEIKKEKLYNNKFVKERFTVTVIARLTKDKGVDIFLKAISEAIKHTAEIDIIIIGQGNMSHELKLLAKELKINFCTKFYSKLKHEEVLGILSESDLFVLPSTEFDPFGIVIIEAMQLKVPTIITNQCGAHSYFTNKETQIVKAGDIKDLQSKIINLYKNPSQRVELSKNAYKKVNSMFLEEMMIENFEKTLLS